MDLDDQAEAHIGIVRAATRAREPHTADEYHRAVVLRARLDMPPPAAR
ncbi:hypothetical protein [Saccharothrix carnea]|nr:hypothetical protein [Saccharothrix carnea]